MRHWPRPIGRRRSGRRPFKQRAPKIVAYLARGDRAKAEQLLLDTAKSQPDDPMVYILAAQVYQAVGASSDAESWLKQLTEKRKMMLRPRLFWPIST